MGATDEGGAAQGAPGNLVGLPWSAGPRSAAAIPEVRLRRSACCPGKLQSDWLEKIGRKFARATSVAISNRSAPPPAALTPDTERPTCLRWHRPRRGTRRLCCHRGKADLCGEGLGPATFIREHGTIYLLGTGAGASATSSFIAVLLEDITETARQLAAHNPGGRLEPPLALVLDEIANLCAVPSLPTLMADGGGSGISTLAVIQSLAQARERWGEQAAAAMWDAATLRLILGGSAQPKDLQDLAAVCGERDEELQNWSRGPDGKRTINTSTRRLQILPPDIIRTLPFGTAILLARTAPPIYLAMTPWINRPDAPDIHRSINFVSQAGAGTPSGDPS